MKAISLSVAVAIGFAMTSSSAFAAEHRLRRKEPKTITVCSDYGRMTCETARLLPKNTLLLKGGTKIDCEGDCRETLRKATVDFWDTFDERAGSD